jgi:uncharacterized protein (DUF1800 family)
MTRSREKARGAATVLVLASLLPPPALPRGAAETERRRAELLRSRATFGARVGDVERILEVGAERWLEEQMHPERIDDSALERRLAIYPDLALSPAELIRKYPRPERAERGARPPSREDAMETERARDPEGERRGKLLVELSHAKLLRAVYSERQLQEVMTDFWFNHFNVYARKNRNVLLSLPSYERDAIRPHVFGKFRDLLGATAEHPAMLVYLDNWVNSKDGFDPRKEMRELMGDARRRAVPRAPVAPENGETERKLGLNENYARELLELHTMGVDGGYTQEDVVAVARAFTGWSVSRPRLLEMRERLRGRVGDRLPESLASLPGEGSFFFNTLAHDEASKTVLGVPVKGVGLSDGLEVLDLLSRRPSTARFVSAKIAERFVSETPPEDLVREMADTFTRTDGDIGAVLRTMFLSPKFAEAGGKDEMVKTPLELVASSLRALGVEDFGPGVGRALRDLGMPLYLCQPPTGYDETSSVWLSAGNLLTRLKFTEDLVAGRIRGVERPEAPVDFASWTKAVAPGFASTEEAVDPSARLALVLASPAFQRQ